MRVFHVFLNCTDDVKSRKASHMIFKLQQCFNSVMHNFPKWSHSHQKFCSIFCKVFEVSNLTILGSYQLKRYQFFGKEFLLTRKETFANLFQANSAIIYLLKVSNRNTSRRSEICSKLTIKTPERLHRLWCFYC